MTAQSGPRLAFLGYDRTQTTLIDHLESTGVSVDHISDRLTDLGAFDFVVSFGYRHILKPETLATARTPPVNLHISFLPYNRGAHPNFWSWVEGTPSGVSIHEVDKGLDTGDIIARRELRLSPEGLSFRMTHAMLIKKIEALFITCWPAIRAGSYRAEPQLGQGTYHSLKDLPGWMTCWDMPITEAIERYHADH